MTTPYVLTYPGDLPGYPLDTPLLDPLMDPPSGGLPDPLPGPPPRTPQKGPKMGVSGGCPKMAKIRDFPAPPKICKISPRGRPPPGGRFWGLREASWEGSKKGGFGGPRRTE